MIEKLFHSLTKEEELRIEKFRILISMYQWKANQMSENDTTPFSKNMIVGFVDASVELLNVLGRLDYTIMKASSILYGNLFEEQDEESEATQ